MMLADGSVVTVGPDRWPELFWATVGGMGLTGIILRATFGMLPIETSRCTVDTERVGDLDALLEAMETGDAGYRYSVAWIDLVARGAALGRSVLTTGRARPPRRAVAASSPCARWRTARTAWSSVPPVVLPGGVLNHATVSAFNEGWFRAAPRRRVGQVDVAHPVLPPARRRRPLEPPVRPARIAAVPVRGAVRRGGGAAHGGRAPGGVGHGQLPGRAQALRRVEPGAAELPVPGVDAGPRPPRRHAAVWSGCWPGSTSSCSRLVAGTTSPRTAHTTPDAIRRGVPPPRRLAARSATRVDPHGRWVSDQSRRLHGSRTEDR